MPTMYDRLGDLLNETLESGEIKFIHIEDKDEVPVEAAPVKDAHTEEESPSSFKQRKEPAKKKRIVYRKLTPELERQYRILDITVSATLEEVKKAYKEKIKYYHPDKHEGNLVLKKVATDKTRQVVEAYNAIVKFLQD